MMSSWVRRRNCSAAMASEASLEESILICAMPSTITGTPRAV